MQNRKDNEVSGGVRGLARVPTSIWILGFVYNVMDVSSEMITLLPVYLITVFGTSTLTVGIIEGIAEATASITKIFSGALERLDGREEVARRPGLWSGRILHKTNLSLAPTVGWLVAARFIDP